MNDDQIGIRGIGTALPERLSEPTGQGLTTAVEHPPGAGACLVAFPAARLAVRAARRALADAALTSSEVDAMLCCAGLPAPTHKGRGRLASREVPDVPPGDLAKWLGEELGVKGADVSQLFASQETQLFDALRAARSLLTAEPGRSHVLCVGADVLPPTGCREILYNVINDAACAVVISRIGARQRWAGFHQISKGYSWDTPFNEGEIIAAYFPTARTVITESLAEARLQPREVDLVIPTAVNATSWPQLLRLCGIPEERLYQPHHRFGHTSASDSFLLLEEAEATGRLRPGMRVLLFTFGIGANWCALLLEVVQASVRRRVSR